MTQLLWDTLMQDMTLTPKIWEELGAPKSQRGIMTFRQAHSSKMMLHLDCFRLWGVDLRHPHVHSDLLKKLLQGRTQWGWILPNKQKHPISDEKQGAALVISIFECLQKSGLSLDLRRA